MLLLNSTFSKILNQSLLNKFCKACMNTTVRFNSGQDFKDDLMKMEYARRSYVEPKNPSHIPIKTSVLWSEVKEKVAALKSFTQANEVLNYLKSNPEVTPDMYAPIFNTMFTLHKSGNSKLSKNELFRSPEIEQLARLVKRDIKRIKVDDCVTLLKCLTYFDVSTNSILGQHLLQYIGQKVNILDIRQVILLSFIVRNCQSSPLSEILKSSLPMVFETHIKTQFNCEDPHYVLNCLIYALREKTLSDETKAMVVDAAIQINDRFDHEQILKILMHLTYRHRNVIRIFSLFNIMIDKMIERLDKYNWKDIVLLLGNVLDRYVHSNTTYFNEPFVMAVINHCMEKHLDSADVGALLKHLNRVSYYSPELIDYLDQILNRMDSFEEIKVPSTIYYFIAACSNCCHKPVNWPLYESRIVSFIENRSEMNSQLVRITTDLLVMKCWSTPLIEKCFSSEYIVQYVKSGSFLDQLCFLNLYQIAKVFHPEGYTGSWPPKNVIEDIEKEMETSRQYPLLNTLEHALGGVEYVLPGVKTNFAHHIQYLIVKRKSGKLHPVNPNKLTTTSGTLIDSLEIPENSYLIAVMLLSPASFCFEGLRVRGKIQIFLRSIESLGISVVPVSEIEWVDLPDVERIPYLLDKINTTTPVAAEEDTLEDCTLPSIEVVSH